MTRKSVNEYIRKLRAQDPSVCLGLVLYVGIVVAAAVAWVFFSVMEAAAYNRVTGKNVSAWDAMWIDLRVQEGAKP